MRTSISKVVYFILAAWLMAGCVESPNFPDEPRIEFIGLSKDTMQQGNFLNDSLTVVFRFEDGDGDIGKTETEPDNNVFFIDDRTGTLESTFGIPYIPQEGAGNGVEGEVRILLYTTCCLFTDGSIPCEPNPNEPLDTLRYRIYMKDRAGHESNEIVTTPIIILCQ